MEKKCKCGNVLPDLNKCHKCGEVNIGNRRMEVVGVVTPTDTPLREGQIVVTNEYLEARFNELFATFKSNLIKQIEGKENKGRNGEGLPYENSPEIYGNQRQEAYKKGYNSALSDVIEILRKK